MKAGKPWRPSVSLEEWSALEGFEDSLQRDYPGAPRRFNRRGEAMSYADYVEASQDPDYQQLAKDEFDDWSISTVWLGVDHGGPWPGRWGPAIFETLVQGPDDQDATFHYTTEADAYKGHGEAVAAARAGVFPFGLPG